MNNTSDSTILVAEDDADSRHMLRTFLELNGYQVVEAQNGEEAVKVACSTQPDLILMDLNMPKLGGFEAAEKIRQCEKLRAVPILTNSSSGKYGMELFLNIEKLDGGYLEYIPKPFNFEYLLEMIEMILLKTKKALLRDLQV
jgi:CheY-like chemotaxis protein